MKKTRTRFAPSPTGYMHIGNLRSALFTYLIAKHEDGDFILRIEDTDQSRQVEGAVDVIYDTLELCDITVDEGPRTPKDVGPYVQSERLPIYSESAEELVKKGKAYYCFCTEERLESLRKEAELLNVAFLYDKKCMHLSEEEVQKKLDVNVPYVIRQKIPEVGETTYNDAVYGEITVQNKLMEDQILLKSDKYPTYNFANVVDDHFMKISHVVRGNEYLSSTPKYILLYEAFGWDIPEFVHLPHIVKEGGKKLSKRAGDASFMDLYQDGYLPEAIINYLALLGWSSPNNQEIFSLEELEEVFDYKRINKAPAVYDIKKLQWINSQYIKKMTFNEFKDFVMPFIKEVYNIDDKDDAWLNRLLEIYQNHISYGKEIVDEAAIFFNDEINLSDEAKEVLAQEKVLSFYKEELKNITDWNEENINQAISSVKEKSGIKGKDLFMPIRIKVSGYMHGPELPATIYLIGQEKVLRRLDEVL